MSVADCLAGSPVVRWWGNGFSGMALRVFVMIYPHDCLLVGPLSSWGWGVPPLMNKPLHITFGINNELSTSAPYKVSQQWAQYFFMHEYGGIWYRPRFL